MAETIALAQRLDISAAMRLLNDLRGADGPVELDVAKTKTLGALCVQILISFSREAKATGREFKLVNVSDEIVSQLSSMGVSPERIMEGTL
jgi:anti-anti-sigma regulatory factor